MKPTKYNKRKTVKRRIKTTGGKCGCSLSSIAMTGGCGSDTCGGASIHGGRSGSGSGRGRGSIGGGGYENEGGGSYGDFVAPYPLFNPLNDPSTNAQIISGRLYGGKKHKTEKKIKSKTKMGGYSHRRRPIRRKPRPRTLKGGDGLGNNLIDDNLFSFKNSYISMGNNYNAGQDLSLKHNFIGGPYV
jgi:hypothetical protein